MRYVTKAVLLLTILLSLSSCGTTVEPGQRGLRWYPLTQGLTTETLKSGVRSGGRPGTKSTCTTCSGAVTPKLWMPSARMICWSFSKPPSSCARFPKKCISWPKRSVRFLSTCGQARIVGCRPKRRLQLSDGHSAGEEC